MLKSVRCKARISLLLCAMMFCAAAAMGQEEDAKAPRPKAARPAARAPAAAKAPADKAAPAEKAGPSRAEPEMPPLQEPAVQMVEDSKPTTPAECIRAAKILADLQHPDLAKKYLQKALDAQPSKEQLLDLAKQFGLETIMDMAAQAELCPPARRLADAIVAADKQQAEDPQHLADLVKKAQNAAPEVRAEAVAGLKQARTAGIEALLAVLADREHPAEHPRARAALVEMGSDAAGPMLAILADGPPAMQVDAVKVLTDLRVPEVTAFLFAPYCAAGSDPQVRSAADAALTKRLRHTPARAEALRTLLELADAYYQKRMNIRGQMEGRVALWRWDAQKKSCMVSQADVDDASRTMAARLARDAVAIAPEDRQARRLFLAAALDEAVYRRGLDRALDVENDPVVRAAARYGAASLNDALEFAMAGGHAGAEIGLAQVLGRVGTPGEVLRGGAQPSALVQAAADPDPRVRLAALEAVVRLQPDGPFPGSSRVLDSLCFLAATSGARRVLLAGADVTGLKDIAVMLSALGYQVDQAHDGRQAIRLALACPDYEAAFIDTTIDEPPAAILLAQFRRDYRTASLRVGILARYGSFRAAERIAREDPLSMAFSRPHTPDAVAWQLAQLATLNPREFVGFTVRQAQAARAMRLLAALARSSSMVYDLRRAEPVVLAALSVPTLTAPALEVLAQVGTPEVQQTLVDLAGRSTPPMETRWVAAAAFHHNMERFGVLLGEEAIRRQYDLYKHSGSEDTAAKRVLKFIVDCIEAPRQPVNAAAPAKAPEPAKAQLPMKEEGRK